jgi:cobyrinic acid a,c-diamide synthase
MGPERVFESFTRHALTDGINLVEGNRGVFDGLDAAGTHSSAGLAQCLSAPLILVVNASKVTRTAAAFVLGCQKLDPGIAMCGVILNNVSGERHQEILRNAIESACRIPVVGALPKAKISLLPERHLGLVPPEEHPALEKLDRDLLNLVDGRLDLDALLSIARAAPPLQRSMGTGDSGPITTDVNIGYLKDAAFSFYYPENLEQLERAGGKLIPVSALKATSLPDNLQALYIGGGFPESYAQALTENSSFLRSVKGAALRGLPMYAECGGLMLLAKNLMWKDARYAMAGLFPFEVEVRDTPQGHGYSELRVDKPNPFFPVGLILRGHEFHYSCVLASEEATPTACAVNRGTGCFEKREFVTTNNVVATYTHLHALGSPEWATGIVNAARVFALQAGDHGEKHGEKAARAKGPEPEVPGHAPVNSPNQQPPASDSP